MNKTLNDILPPNVLPNTPKRSKTKKARTVNQSIRSKQARPIKDVAACDDISGPIIDQLRESNGLAPAEDMKSVITRENAEKYKDLHVHSSQTDHEKGYLQKVATGVGVPKNLPLLDEVRREFAFRYATEHRKKKEWCDIFNISPYTLRNWLSREDVAQYIAKVRRDRNSLMSERLLNLEKKAYAKLDGLLDLNIEDPDNALIVQSSIRDVLSMMGADINGKGSGTNTPAVQIYNTQQTQNNQITSDPSELKSEIDDLHKQLAELDILSGAFEEMK